MDKGFPQQLLLGLQLDEAATLDNFQIAAADQQLLKHLQESIISADEFLTFMWGPEGTGKTHLLQALCQESTGQGKAAIYLPLTNSDQVAPEMLEGLETLNLVCLDDIEAIIGEAAWEQALFSFYNRARANNTCLVVTARKPPADLAIDLADLHSRLQSGVVFQLHELSDPEKAKLLNRRARLLGISLPKAVIDYVLQRHDRQVSALMQLLQELDKLSLEQQRPITIPFVRQLMNW